MTNKHTEIFNWLSLQGNAKLHCNSIRPEWEWSSQSKQKITKADEDIGKGIFIYYWPECKLTQSPSKSVKDSK